MAGKTLFEKIWDNHVVVARDDGKTLLYVDRQLLPDWQHRAYDALVAQGRSVRKPKQNFAMPDHSVPTTVTKVEEITEDVMRIPVEELERHSKNFGVVHFDLTDDRLAVGGRLLGVRTPRGLYDEVFLSLHGAHQAENASLALTAVEEFFDSPLPDDVVEEAFGTVAVPGRLEVVHRSPTIVIDTAHNVPGAAALAESIADDFGQGGRRYLVLGMQDGRVPVDVTRALQVANYQLVATCTAPTARGVAAETLADAVREAGGQADAVFDVESAFDHVYNQAEDDDLIVVAGSNPVVGIVRTLAEDL